MGMVTIYKEDSTKESWECILNDLGLPSDTDEICVKEVSHMTETIRKKNRETKNASNNN